MDDLTLIEARRDANIANLRRAFASPLRDELPATFDSLLRRLAEKDGLRQLSAHQPSDRAYREA